MFCFAPSINEDCIYIKFLMLTKIKNLAVLKGVCVFAVDEDLNDFTNVRGRIRLVFC